MKSKRKSKHYLLSQWLIKRLQDLAETYGWTETRALENALEKGLNWYSKKTAREGRPKKQDNDTTNEPKQTLEEVTDEEIDAIFKELFDDD